MKMSAKVDGLLSILIVAVSSAANAESITAICKGPYVRLIGQDGAQKAQEVNIPDGMPEGVITINWDISSQEASIIFQAREGEKPFSDKGLLILATEEQFSFLVLYPQAVWMYSLYPNPELLLISSHNNGMGLSGMGALNKSLKAKCEISLQ
jgi:hypothetical protein